MNAAAAAAVQRRVRKVPVAARHRHSTVLVATLPSWPSRNWVSRHRARAGNRTRDSDSVPWSKNNPVLLGEAGVGKTAIVEGFAQMVVDGQVPDILADRRIIVLDLAMMVAGTSTAASLKNASRP